MSFKSQCDKLTEGILQQCRRERKDRLDLEDLPETVPPLKNFLESDPREQLRQLQCVDDLNLYVMLNKTSAQRCFQVKK